MKTVFLDTEFTGEHQHTTLVSLGLVTLEGASLYVILNDYDRAQVTPWLRENVLAHIDPAEAVSSTEAYRIVSDWLSAYAGRDRIRLVSAGLGLDITLLFQLWAYANPTGDFHWLHCLPPSLNHSGHVDLNTLFSIAGLDPQRMREEFAPMSAGGRRHDALSDAQVVRNCYLKLITTHPQLAALRL